LKTILQKSYFSIGLPLSKVPFKQKQAFKRKVESDDKDEEELPDIQEIANKSRGSPSSRARARANGARKGSQINKGSQRTSIKGAKGGKGRGDILSSIDSSYKSKGTIFNSQ
jgi:hypothetical protein